VLALKRGALPLADLMAGHMLSAPGVRWGAVGATLVPVPSHPLHRRVRGSDHAAALAAALGARSGLPVVRALARGGAPARPAGASRSVRRGRRLAIRAVAPAPELAVLVDDVHTTGATLDACARALISAGARRVEAVTYARALR
jgi:predicted amidophosphoribosyltransferase